jgi:PIN domain
LLPTSTQRFDRASETSPRLELNSNRFGALLPDGIVAAFEASGFEMLPISSRHATDAPTLPSPHSDPFDCMLIAQTECEGLVIVTADRQFDSYDIKTLTAQNRSSSSYPHAQGKICLSRYRAVAEREDPPTLKGSQSLVIR